MQLLTSPQRDRISSALCRFICKQLTGRKYRRLGMYIERVEHRDGQGNLLWEDHPGHNALVDGGEKYFLQVGLTGEMSKPANFYLLLSTQNESTMGETVTLAGLTEVSGTGYARQAIPSAATTGWTTSLNSGDWQGLSISVVFTAGGTWTSAVAMVLATTIDNTGVPIATKDLSTTRTLQNTDTLTCTITIKLS